MFLLTEPVSMSLEQPPCSTPTYSPNYHPTKSRWWQDQVWFHRLYLVPHCNSPNPLPGKDAWWQDQLSADLLSFRAAWKEELDQAVLPEANLHFLMEEYLEDYGVLPRTLPVDLEYTDKLESLLHAFHQEHGGDLLKAHLVDTIKKEWGYASHSGNSQEFPPPEIIKLTKTSNHISISSREQESTHGPGNPQFKDAPDFDGIAKTEQINKPHLSNNPKAPISAPEDAPDFDGIAKTEEIDKPHLSDNPKAPISAPEDAPDFDSIAKTEEVDKPPLSNNPKPSISAPSPIGPSPASPPPLPVQHYTRSGEGIGQAHTSSVCSC